MATNRYILIWHLTLKVHLLFKNPGNFKKKKNVSHCQRFLINSESNRLLNNCWISEEIKATIRGYLENGDSEIMAWQNLQDTAQTVLKWHIRSPKNNYFHRKNENNELRINSREKVIRKEQRRQKKNRT